MIVINKVMHFILTNLITAIYIYVQIFHALYFQFDLWKQECPMLSACSALVWAEMQDMQMKMQAGKRKNTELLEEGKQDLYATFNKFTNIYSLHEHDICKLLSRYLMSHFIVNFNLFQHIFEEGFFFSLILKIK